MKKYVLCVGIKHWTLRKYDDAMIEDANNVWDFDSIDGFDSTADVLDYIELYFRISREQISINQ